MNKETLRQTITFTLLSFSAGAVEALSFTLLKLLDMAFAPAQTISVILSVIWNFTLNRRFTFKSTGNIPTAMLKVAAFYVFFIPASAYFGRLASQAGINDFLIKAFMMILNLILEFLWWKFVVFRKEENTREKSA